MSEDYAVLAPIYDRVGMADYASTMTPRLLNFAQQNGWLGRRILDLGCGTGVSSLWFGQHGYTVMGIDKSPEMVAQADTKLKSESITAPLIEDDIRTVRDVDAADMAIALDVMNEMDNLRDLEAAFQNVHELLSPGRLFIFDLHTLEGLARISLLGDQMLLNEEDLVVFVHGAYNFERQAHTMDFDVFERDAEGAWHRNWARLSRRAYPIQAVATLLRRQGLEIVTIVNTRLEPFDPDTSNTPRAIFVAKRQ